MFCFVQISYSHCCILLKSSPFFYFILFNWLIFCPHHYEWFYLAEQKIQNSAVMAETKTLNQLNQFLCKMIHCYGAARWWSKHCKNNVNTT